MSFLIGSSMLKTNTVYAQGTTANTSTELSVKK